MIPRVDPDRLYVEIGEISGVWGVHGWVKVYAYTRDRAGIFDYPTWYLGENRVSFDLIDGHRQSHGLVAQLKGIGDRDAAHRLVGQRVRIPMRELPLLAAGEFYWVELQGLRAVTLDGIELGRVERLEETGANDVLVVSGERQRLVPYTENVVYEVDLGQGVITLDWDPEF